MNEGQRPSEEALRRRLQWLIVARVVVATLLLGGTLLLTVYVRRDGFSSFTSSALIGLIVSIYGASALFAVWLLGGRQLQWNAWGQIIWDLVATSGLVYLSGAAGSPFTLLYGISVLAAAVTLGPAPARTVAGVSLLAYLTVAYTVATAVIPYPTDQPAGTYELGPSELGYSLLSNGVALALVAALAGSLAERLLRAGGRLAEAEASAAALARMNDDIVRSMSAGLLTADVDGFIQSINPAGAATFGAEASDLLGINLNALIPTRVDRTGRGDTTAHRPDGTTFPIGFTRTDLHNREGFLLVFQDLTEIRRLQDLAERAERLAALGRLSSALAHEIRNPLGSISGSVQLVRQAPGLNDEDRSLLSIVLREVDRLNELVTTMLDVGRPTRPRPTLVDIGSIAEDVAAVARADTTLGSVTIQVDAEEDVVATLDANQIRQLLWNLLKNAVQASPAKGTVTIGARDEGAEVVIWVADHGDGIPEEEQEHLFDMFYSKRDQGIGLGLALVQQIVDAHAGDILVESSSAGTTICVTLPKAVAETFAEAAAITSR
ncbi:MAG: ATP-binding protein [Myxococcota bacterium]